MDKQLNILVIGDSASAPFGIFEGTYLDCMLQRKYDRPVAITNLSTFNMTSVDAYFLADKWFRKQKFDCLILALGNCDACAYGYEKKIYPLLSKGCNQHLNRFLSNRAKKKNPISRRLPPYTFRHIANGAPLKTGTVGSRDFATNIKRIRRLATRNGVQFLLLNLDSNRTFPPCNNIGNYSYYKVFGVPSSLPYSGLGESNALNEALHHHDAGNPDYAEELYRRIADKNPDNELLHIASNNLASIHFDRGDTDKALELLDSIPKNSPMAPLVFYNRAITARAQGNEDEARTLFGKAFESDFGSYRIKTPYRKSAASAAKKGELIDCADSVSQDDFQDYCHPGVLSHEKLAEELDKRLRDFFKLDAGSVAPSIAYKPENPDTGAGFTADFFWHFGIAAIPDSRTGHELEEIPASYESVLKHADKIIDDRKLASMNSILSHPLFGCRSLLEIIHPRLKTDLGRVPELFALRMMLPVYKGLEAVPSALKDMKKLATYVPSHAKIRQWWPTLQLPSLEETDAVMNKVAEGVDWSNVAERMEALLLHSLDQKVVFPNRIRGITNWFMRESIIFAPVSRPNQLYRRKDFLALTDSFLVYWGSQSRSTSLDERFLQTVQWADEALAIHEEYVSSLKPDQPNTQLLKKYEEALNKLAEQIRTALEKRQ